MTMVPEQKGCTLLQPKKTSDTSVSPEKFRGGVEAFEKELGKVTGAMYEDCFPLEHKFVDGAYVRTITIPADIVMTSKIHKVTHPYFVMKGEVDVLTESGIQRIKAPYQGITMAGTKRILRTYTEVVWTTVHVTNETDLDKIENQVIAKSYEELGLEKEDICLGQLSQQELSPSEQERQVAQ